jgi:predicted transcriptional regulator
MNTIAHLNAAFGARKGKELFYQNEIETKDNKKIKLNISDAIIIKKSNLNKDLINLSKKAKEENFEIAEFTREMLETTDDKKIIEITKNKNLNSVEYLGVLIFGKKKEIEELTKDFELYK